MVFKASKIRQRKKPEPIAKGTQLIASATTQSWYDRSLEHAFSEMMADYRAELILALDTEPVKEVFSVGDASATEIMKLRLDRLRGKWVRKISSFALNTSREFLRKVDKHSKTTVANSLRTAGVKEPRSEYNANVLNTIEASYESNYTLITGLADEVHDKIYDAVMLSLSSPNPQEQGQPAILAALDKTASITGDRAKLIARDQTHKVYASLNVQRMKQNGIEKFMWIHSSAGKVPRPSHVARDREIYTIDDPRLWEGPKADQGPPGWAINCRCRAVPVLDLD